MCQYLERMYGGDLTAESVQQLDKTTAHETGLLESGVGYDAQHCDGIDALCRLLAGKLHDRVHHIGKSFPDWPGHSSTCNVAHSWTTLDDRASGGGDNSHSYEIMLHYLNDCTMYMYMPIT